VQHHTIVCTHSNLPNQDPNRLLRELFKLGLGFQHLNTV